MSVGKQCAARLGCTDMALALQNKKGPVGSMVGSQSKGLVALCHSVPYECGARTNSAWVTLEYKTHTLKST